MRSNVDCEVDELELAVHKPSSPINKMDNFPSKYNRYHGNDPYDPGSSIVIISDLFMFIDILYISIKCPGDEV